MASDKQEVVLTEEQVEAFSNETLTALDCWPLQHRRSAMRGMVQRIAEAGCKTGMEWRALVARCCPDCCEHCYGTAIETAALYVGEYQRGVGEGLERAAGIAENGRFLHDDSPEARLGKECAAAIRRAAAKEEGR